MRHPYMAYYYRLASNLRCLSFALGNFLLWQILHTALNLENIKPKTDSDRESYWAQPIAKILV